MESVSYPIEVPLDLARTMASLRHGPGDPTTTIEGYDLWRATRTPDGPVALQLRVNGPRLQARAWGPGSAWMLERVPDLAGLADPAEEFLPADPVMRSLNRRFPGLRLPRTGRVMEAMVPAILGQRVTGGEAGRGYRGVLRRFGGRAPGPVRLVVPPDPADLAAIPYHQFHPLGVERRRAETLRRAAARAGRLEEAVGLSRELGYRRLQAIPGVGPWTAALVMLAAGGDADAVPVGDYHLPSTVAWNLAGQPRAGDQRMLELLEPYRGHRARVLRLLALGGRRAPSFGPRREVRSIAAI